MWKLISVSFLGVKINVPITYISFKYVTLILVEAIRSLGEKEVDWKTGMEKNEVSYTYVPIFD